MNTGILMSKFIYNSRLYCKFIRYISIFYSKGFFARFYQKLLLFKKIFEHYTVKNVRKFTKMFVCIIIFNIYLCILCGDVKFDDTVWVGVGRNLMIIGEIWLIQVAKKRLLWMGQVSLTTSVKINWFNGEK